VRGSGGPRTPPLQAAVAVIVSRLLKLTTQLENQHGHTRVNCRQTDSMAACDIEQGNEHTIGMVVVHQCVQAVQQAVLVGEPSCYIVLAKSLVMGCVSIWRCAWGACMRPVLRFRGPRLRPFRASLIIRMRQWCRLPWRWHPAAVGVSTLSVTLNNQFNFAFAVTS
jgi:hypothetical protein